MVIDPAGNVHLTNCTCAAPPPATAAARGRSAFPKQSTNQTSCAVLPVESMLFERQVHSCTFKYGNAPLLSAISIPMNNQQQPQLRTQVLREQRHNRAHTHWCHPGLNQFLNLTQLLAFSCVDYFGLALFFIFIIVIKSHKKGPKPMHQIQSWLYL